MILFSIEMDKKGSENSFLNFENFSVTMLFTIFTNLLAFKMKKSIEEEKKLIEEEKKQENELPVSFLEINKQQKISLIYPVKQQNNQEQNLLVDLAKQKKTTAILKFTSKNCNNNNALNNIPIVINNDLLLNSTQLIFSLTKKIIKIFENPNENKNLEIIQICLNSLTVEKKTLYSFINQFLAKLFKKNSNLNEFIEIIDSIAFLKILKTLKILAKHTDILPKGKEIKIEELYYFTVTILNLLLLLLDIKSANPFENSFKIKEIDGKTVFDITTCSYFNILSPQTPPSFFVKKISFFIFDVLQQFKNQEGSRVELPTDPSQSLDIVSQNPLQNSENLLEHIDYIKNNWKKIRNSEVVFVLVDNIFKNSNIEFYEEEIENFRIYFAYLISTILIFFFEQIISEIYGNRNFFELTKNFETIFHLFAIYYLLKSLFNTPSIKKSIPPLISLIYSDFMNDSQNIIEIYRSLSIEEKEEYQKYLYIYSAIKKPLIYLKDEVLFRFFLLIIRQSILTFLTTILGFFYNYYNLILNKQLTKESFFIDYFLIELLLYLGLLTSKISRKNQKLQSSYKGKEFFILTGVLFFAGKMPICSVGFHEIYYSSSLHYHYLFYFMLLFYLGYRSFKSAKKLYNKGINFYNYMINILDT